jgi:hypothetical protein
MLHDTAISDMLAIEDMKLWRQVPQRVATLIKVATDVKKQVQKAMLNLDVADPGYGTVYWHPKKNNLWVVLSDSDEQDTYNKWWKALSTIPGINKVITESEVGPPSDHINEWVRIKRTKSATMNPFALAGKPFGGPTAMTNSVVGALVGGGLGYGGGKLMEFFTPERYVERGRLAKNMALAGAILGGTPGMLQGGFNMGLNARAGDPSTTRSFLQPSDKQKVSPNETAWREHVMGKSAKIAAVGMSGFGNPAIQAIRVDRFNNAIWHDPYSPPAVNAAAAGIVSGIQQQYGGASVLTPRHFIKGLAAAGVDYATATLAGGVLGALGGLKPEAQQSLQQMGLWSGLIRGSIGSILGQ